MRLCEYFLHIVTKNIGEIQWQIAHRYSKYSNGNKKWQKSNETYKG